MDMMTDTGRAFWRGMLAAGGLTTIPRWTLDPRPGLGEHHEALPEDLLGALRRLADGLGTSVDAVLLTAHARVLATLAGEREVVTGYGTAPGGEPVPCRLTIDPGSWRDLLTSVARLEGELRSHLQDGHGVDLDGVRRELGLRGPVFETELIPRDTPGEPADGTVLQLSVSNEAGGARLRLRYRTDALDAPAAARIAGYHARALAAMAADPDGEHARACLLTPEELRFQLEDLAGPRRELPDLRVHEVLEQRAGSTPDAVAAVHGEALLTYRELNARANRLGRALQAWGLDRETVVTVVTERNLDWMVTVLAIWKAGLTYLPLEPHFPPERMATAISRAESPLVVTERASTAMLDQALSILPGVTELFVEDLAAEDHPEGDLGVDVAAGQLAYILFTSGSTGQPKGVMCEHAGMLNHILAKIDDLGVREGEVIPQTGPQCFDISVWQLVAALLVGGRTLLVDQDAILDVERFVDTIVDGHAGVIQVVPSYLDVIVSYLEQHPRELPDLHCVCPTGDFLKKELVQRWFALYPHIPVVNTYGLTETSDDAVHEIMDRPPAGPGVPLGRPINNTHVDVVDEFGTPVPLGAPGLIVFSGVCVGRGYVNDPERTAAMFGDDPHRAGARICRTGDYGRWRPDGKLDFLGRRDNQVKIRGFRIEIGEIENALLGVPGVRDGAVVVGRGPDQSAFLVAFYSGDRPLEAEELRTRMAGRVPDYMVPSAYRWQERLPLTGNGKIDRKTLGGMAQDTVAHPTPTEELTAAEQRLAGAWGSVLGLPPERISRQDSFFELGGTSLSAVKLVVLLQRAVSLQQVMRTPVLADLACLLDTHSAPPDQDPGRDRLTTPTRSL
ncbi:amino acid adenylation domain-containing protein [Citricoccus sp.]|uniref:non-ribosomal peptide synthetase n=1 Tax=Citricoccus sp. TaxID=1978372 RepID=UPI002638A5BA|nr:amino acid adenylation domain-containing protein [Citricoccus sp.]HRO30614.1 amino acid adenylation domain-containing protein [Citricoccus sp.]HRO94437.1 amino acid adenylation domain-containing protein [Citricoccus sp.]